MSSRIVGIEPPDTTHIASWTGALQLKYGDLLHVSVIGKSALGRRIYAYRLGRGQRNVLYCGGVHGREWITSLLLLHFADELRECGHTLDIYELEGRCEPDDIPSSRIPELLPRADIVLMTSSTILTHATEEILSCCHKEACKMIVGPTVPLHPCLWSFGKGEITSN